MSAHIKFPYGMGILDGNHNSHASAIHLSKITATFFRVLESLVFYDKSFPLQPENPKNVKIFASAGLIGSVVLASAPQTQIHIIPSDLSAALAKENGDDRGRTGNL